MGLPRYLQGQFESLSAYWNETYAGIGLMLLIGSPMQPIEGDRRRNLSLSQLRGLILCRAQFGFAFAHRGRPGLPRHPEDPKYCWIEVSLFRAAEYEEHLQWIHEKMPLLYMTRENSYEVATQKVRIQFANRWRVDNPRTGAVSSIGYDAVYVIPEARQKAEAWAARKEKRSRLAASLSAQREYWENKVIPGRKWPADLRMYIFTRDGFRCVFCNRHRDELAMAEVPLEVDHKVAVEDGGETRASNGQTACRECNLGKHLVKQFASTLSLAEVS